jgi:hypothetical protein
VPTHIARPQTNRRVKGLAEFSSGTGCALVLGHADLYPARVGTVKQADSISITSAAETGSAAFSTNTNMPHDLRGHSFWHPHGIKRSHTSRIVRLVRLRVKREIRRVHGEA